jgi:hypothetical protein
VYYRREDVLLTAIRAQLRRDRRSKSSALGAATVVCMVLLVLLAVAQVVHTHPVESDADHCPLCIAMHSVVPIVALVAAAVLVRIDAAAPVPLEIHTIVRYWHPTLFTRPPPAGC